MTKSIEAAHRVERPSAGTSSVTDTPSPSPVAVEPGAIEGDFTQWLRQNIDRRPVARPQIEEILKSR
jgi:hypothetical protein